MDKQRPTPSVLVVTQPATPGCAPLPGTRTEARCLREVLDRGHIASTTLEDKAATVASVKGAMRMYPWVHLACHGMQQTTNPTESGFALHDGPLTLGALMEESTDRAELATEEYIPYAHVLEGFVILKKNPGYEKDDKMEL